MESWSRVKSYLTNGLKILDEIKWGGGGNKLWFFTETWPNGGFRSCADVWKKILLIITMVTDGTACGNES